ncbi:receptor-like protein 50 [Trifolium pratense]|uniref:receptor-like protein 50 n=1 Tax=Trifolium pratense TaxID=57577 RepID=UPI001E697D16|nr:receptor-like protein 50 [Trifolium pratense]
MRITLALFLICYYSIYITHVSPKCLEDQQSLLLQLKNNFTFLDKKPLYSPIIHQIISRSTKLKMWNKTTDCCNWSGVTCDNEGHAIGLDLSGEHIVGGFNNSSSLFSLQHLQKLDLSDNYFNSSIPSGFSKLEKLTYLNLSMAGFVGRIPAVISQLTRLVTLDLSFISYSTKPQIPNLQKFIQNLTKIRKLYLDDISITSQGHEWSNALLPLHDLQELSMYNCDLSGPLDSSLTKLENLSIIILDGNNFSSPIPKTFANFKNLTTLSLSDCGLIGTFPQKIFQIKTLSILDISFNLYLQGSFPEFPLNGSIHTLLVGFTSFSGEIPRTIGNLRNLFELDLYYCQFYGTLPSSMSNLTHLTFLQLSHNHLNGIVPSFLFSIPSLEEIWLPFNQFSKFDESINVSSSILKILDLSYNYLSGPFPMSISQLHSLNNLDISSNRLNDSLQLDAILELSNLIELDLSHNSISINVNVTNVGHVFLPNIRYINFASCNLKTFPNFLLNQSTLFSLDLSDNQIQGKIPNWIWELQYLKIFNISHNLLTDLEAPRQNLISNLRLLDISFNYIYGTISPSLIAMTSTLMAINLMNNNFNGVIPDMFPTSCALRTLNFHGNLLHGPIPHSLSHCSSIAVLDIGSNQIFGGFPCFLKNLMTLLVLVLRNNRLHGSIECSHSLENKPWKTIQIVDIAFNNFNGKLPEKFFTTWEKMMHDEDHVVSGFIHSGTIYYSYQDSVTVSIKGQQVKLVKILSIFTTIDFSSNYFEGPIPEVLMDFKAIHVLNFSNNALSGEIPPTIGNLKQLESLDLSNNSLVGEIPTQIASLSFLSCLNLSYNHLVGKIPTGTQLQSFEASSFEGNDGLYGLPLTKKLDYWPDLPPQPSSGRLASSIDWNFLSVELGIVFGLGIIIGPIMFWKQWRVRYWKFVDKILCWLFSRIYLEYTTDRGKAYTVLRWRYH